MYLPPSKRLRRSELAVPGSSEKMMAKGAASAADFVFLDLEDAVAPSAKAEARGKVVTALNTLDWGKKTRCVRINDVETEYCYNDIIEVVEGARENLDVIMIPKVRHPRDLHFVETLLNQLELKLKLKKRIGLEVLIEEVEGLINVEQIARCSPRLEALILGMGDYSASQGMDQKEIWGSKDYPGDLWHYPRYKVVIAARAAGIDAIDGPFADFRNAAGYEIEARRGAIMGFVGKWAIHPSQIEPANKAHTPLQADVDKARAMAAAYAKALEQGLGSIALDGSLVDVATVRAQSGILHRADLIGM